MGGSLQAYQPSDGTLVEFLTIKLSNCIHHYKLHFVKRRIYHDWEKNIFLVKCKKDYLFQAEWLFLGFFSNQYGDKVMMNTK